jgi:hypothetical protein
MDLKIILCATIMAACSHTPLSLKETSVAQVPSNEHLVWCQGSPANCFDAASAFCGDDQQGNLQSHQPGKWLQVAEPGMSFPAMIQQDAGWSMVIRCLDR